MEQARRLLQDSPVIQSVQYAIEQQAQILKEAFQTANEWCVCKRRKREFAAVSLGQRTLSIQLKCMSGHSTANVFARAQHS
jgi:hypothetical protein